MLSFLFVFLNFNHFSLSVDPQILTGLSRKKPIKRCFQSGFLYSEILAFYAAFHGINITLRHLLGVELINSHKLKRHMYTSRGPIFMWRVDGYDKLKSFGFPIDGCIDSYRRKIL